MNEWVWAMVEWYWQGKTEVLGEKHYTAWVVVEWIWAMVEWYWQGKTEVLGEKHNTAWVVDEWMSMGNGGMILTGENWSTGRKTLYSVSGRWMNDYGAMVEWYWQGKTEVLGEKHNTAWMVDGWMEYGAMVEWYWQGKTEVLEEKHNTAWVVDGRMHMVQWWNDTDKGKRKYWEGKILRGLII